MKHKDHRLLAQYLISLAPEIWRNPRRRKAFLVGNILPDFNPITYLRGIRQSRRMAGHDFPYSEHHICRVAIRLRENGVRNIADCYSLGTLIHYLADSFTYPHTADFRDSMREHNRYERALHTVFPDCVREAEQNPVPGSPENLEEFLSAERRRYEQAPHQMRKDGREILLVCTAIYVSILQDNRRYSPFLNK